MPILAHRHVGSCAQNRVTSHPRIQYSKPSLIQINLGEEVYVLYSVWGSSGFLFSRYLGGGGGVLFPRLKPEGTELITESSAEVKILGALPPLQVFMACSVTSKKDDLIYQPSNTSSLSLSLLS
jgi:hypothetical protein